MSSSMSTTLSRAIDHALSYHPPASSHTSLFSDTPSDVDEREFLQSFQRAGEPYLCPLPTGRQPIGKNYRLRSLLTRDPTQIIEIVSSILDNAGIQHDEVGVTERRSEVDPEPWPISAVLVTAKRRSSSEDWRLAAKQIYDSISTLYAGLCVELIDIELDQPFRCFPIRVTDSIYTTWDSIRDTILNEFDIWDWTALECWRYGPGPDAQNNPATMIVSIRKDSIRLFHTDARRRIREILARFEEDAAVL